MDPADAVWTAFLDLDRAFAAGDIDGVIGRFTQDPDLTLWRSAEAEHAVGPEELRSFVTWMAGLAGSFTIDYSEHRVTVDGAVAWVNAAGTATWDDGAGQVKQMPHRVTAGFPVGPGAGRGATRNRSPPRAARGSPA